MTTYLVLKETEGGWHEVEVVSAHGAEQAIHAVVAEGERGDGRYVAVPTRSWNPANVRREVQTYIRIET